MSVDELAVAPGFERRKGAGAATALVLGGGGIFFIAWQIGYLRSLQKAGVPIAQADLAVGTSAGSIVAAIVTGGRLEFAAAQVDMFAKLPALSQVLSPASEFRASQLRALEAFRTAEDADPATIRRIGYAALAANAQGAPKLRRTVAGVLAMRKWPAALRVVTVDAYTGERLVLGPDSQVPLATACAASSSVPGIFSPQPVADRKCMDGGVSGSGLHCDVVAGARKVLVINLAVHMPNRIPAMTITPEATDAEIAALKASGSDVFVQGPAQVDMTTLMRAESIPVALDMARQQAVTDAPALLTFFNTQ